MPKSRNRGKRNTRRREMAALEQQLGPDESAVVYEFPDGWTIRRLTTLRDELREGLLMNHCLRRMRLGLDLSTPAVQVEMSLRDTDNYPHVTCYHTAPEQPDDAGNTCDVVGHSDTRPIKPAYAQRLADWHRSLPYLTVIDAEADEFDAVDYLDAIANDLERPLSFVVLSYLAAESLAA